MDTEISLLTAARKMDQDALVKIFDLYAPALFNYTLRLCGDPVMADHIVGDVFAKLLEQLLAGKGPTSNLRSYLYQTAHNRIIDEARSSKHRAPLEVATFLTQDTYSTFISLEDQLLFKQILKAIQNELSNDQRHVIVLRFLEGFSLHETATIMGKTVSHIKVIQNRAMAALRKSLESKGIQNAMFSSKIGNFPNVSEG
jgi:RNA polymerase sigma factor (sigma-70 family)